MHNLDDLIGTAIKREPITAALLTNLFSVLLQLDDKKSADYAGLSELHNTLQSTALRMNHVVTNRKDPLVYFFLQMWPTFDLDSNGALNVAGTEKMIQYFTGKVPEKSAVTAFLVGLSGDENYSLKRGLLQLVQDASKCRMSESFWGREKKTSSCWNCLMVFVISTTQALRLRCVVFPCCDLDGDNGLNTVEATVLFQSFSNEVCSRAHLEQFLSG